MAAELLQEYLIKLGYQVDKVSAKQMDDNLSAMSKKLFGVGTAAAATVASLAAATTAFAYNMRKVYFTAELSNTTVKNLQALKYAGEQVGVSGDAMESAVHSMAQIMRLNPGMVQYASALTGINEAGKDTTDVFVDLVKATKGMDEFAGARLLQQFGIDPDTYHMMRAHLDELLNKRKQALDLQKEYGYDPDKYKKDVMMYTQTLDKLELRLKVFEGAALESFAKPFEFAAKWTDHLIEGMTGWLDGRAWHGFLRMAGLEKEPSASAPSIVQDHQTRAGETEASKAFADRMMRKHGIDISGKTSKGSAYAQAYLEKLGWSPAQAAGIVGNLMRESSMDTGAIGDKGKAYGLAQWHGDRQADFKRLFGHDIRQSTMEEQLSFIDYEMRRGKEQAAGRRLMGATGAGQAGSIVAQYYERPASASEWGARAEIARQIFAPRLAMAGGAGFSNTQNVNITINTTDPKTAGKSVVSALERHNQDALRNYKAAGSLS